MSNKSFIEQRLKDNKENIMGKRIKDATRIDENMRKAALAQFLGIDEADIEDEIEESSYDDQMFEANGNEYLVVTDDEADDRFKEYQEQLWDEMGPESFSSSFRDWIYENAISDRVWNDIKLDIENWIYEEPTSYWNHFTDKNIEGLQEELIEAILDAKDKDAVGWAEDQGFDLDDYDGDRVDYTEDIKNLVDGLDIEQVLEAAKDSLMDIDVSDAVREYIDQYNNIGEFLNELGYDSEVKANFINPYIDMDMVVEEIQSWDGRGPSLSSYDGAENEESFDGEDFFIYRTN